MASEESSRKGKGRVVDNSSAMSADSRAISLINHLERLCQKKTAYGKPEMVAAGLGEMTSRFTYKDCTVRVSYEVIQHEGTLPDDEDFEATVSIFSESAMTEMTELLTDFETEGASTPRAGTPEPDPVTFISGKLSAINWDDGDAVLVNAPEPSASTPFSPRSDVPFPLTPKPRTKTLPVFPKVHDVATPSRAHDSKHGGKESAVPVRKGGYNGYDPAMNVQLGYDFDYDSYGPPHKPFFRAVMRGHKRNFVGPYTTTKKQANRFWFEKFCPSTSGMIPTKTPAGWAAQGDVPYIL